MLLKLLRNRFTEEYTTGQLYVDDQFFCFTLEDKVRKQGEKVYGETAIPYGMYKVTLDLSPRFGPDTIFIHDVPGFEGIRIHSGNTSRDTLGCIIVGYRITEEGVIVPGTTRNCLLDLKQHIRGNSDVAIQIIS